MAIPSDALEPIPPAEPTPPARRVPPGRWVKENLFDGWFNSLLTMVVGLLLALVVWRALRFVFVTGRWEIVRRNLILYMVGMFPRDQLVRLWVSLGVLAATAGAFTGMNAARLRRSEELAGPARSWRGPAQTVWPWVLFGAVLLSMLRTPGPVLGALAVGVVAAAAHAGGRHVPPGVSRLSLPLVAVGAAGALWSLVGLGGIGWDRWGGLLLTLFPALGGILLSFPLGVALGLGRRSSLPAVRVVCVGYIELIRGVPLIALLFMAAFALGFFLPPGAETPTLVMRAMVALVAFTAAYVAEIVRGGLQSVPRGQIEGAMALGLSPFVTTRRIVLPQALRAVIPALVGQFISLFKDTSLVFIIGLTELLRVAEIVTSQPDFIAQGLLTESYVFASLVYWTVAYSMSKASQRLETRLGVGER
ncbi:MAG TPA: amino acid ABC transporter permease [Actinomycetota bacterium]|nr:amino acid ABC transporter permease [Actinomycetota bacterium]